MGARRVIVTWARQFVSRSFSSQAEAHPPSVGGGSDAVKHGTGGSSNARSSSIVQGSRSGHGLAALSPAPPPRTAADEAVRFSFSQCQAQIHVHYNGTAVAAAAAAAGRWPHAALGCIRHTPPGAPSRGGPWVMGFFCGGALTGTLGFAVGSSYNNGHDQLQSQLVDNLGLRTPWGWQWPLSLGPARAADLSALQPLPGTPAPIPLPPPAAASEGAAAADAATAVLMRDSISRAAATAAPAVVHIVVSSAADASRAPSPFTAGGGSGSSSGSGFIYDPAGYILTNAHVVVSALNAKGSTILVTLQDGRVFQGEVVNLDRPSDLAVVRVSSDEPLPTARMGRSTDLRVGEWVVALGSPLLLKHSVTAGIISCVERKGSELGLYGARHDYIQTDAAVNQGNSGGPLINLDGEVIGINNMKAVAADGVSFAIPIDTAKDIVQQMARHGRVVRPYVGITMAEINGSNMKQLRRRCPDFPEGVRRGIAVSRVVPGSPAATAGLLPDDVIVSFAGEQDVSISGLAEAFKQHIASNVDLEVLRQVDGGKYSFIKVQLQPVEAPAE